MVFWFVILGWLAAQNIIALPLIISLQFSNPELFNQLIEMSTATQAEKSGTLADSYGLFFFISTLLGILFWIVNRFGTGQVRKVSGWLAALTVGISILMMILLAPSVFGDSESSELIGALMASGPFAYATFLIIFPASLIALYLGQKLLHKRSLLSLHTSAKKIRWSRGLQAFFVTWIVLFFGVISIKVSPIFLRINGLLSSSPAPCLRPCTCLTPKRPRARKTVSCC